VVEPLGGPAYWWPFAAAFLVGYGLGSIPFGLLLTRWSGAGDVRRIGSGNIGATNVLRTGRKGLALATLLLDLAKGGLPTALGYAWFGPDVAVLAGAGAILGHCFPAWLGFRGGKGVATFLGILIGLKGSIALIFAAVWLSIAYLSRYSSLSALTASLLTPLLFWFWLRDVQTAQVLGVLAILLWFMHRENIARLLAGREGKIGQKG
jgi:glycerol-3-phosphate acyltransferase PlsY